VVYVSNVPLVGGDVDAFCTRCKLKLGHTVLAIAKNRIARVRCNTCQGEHAYRVSAPGTAKPRRESSGRSTRPEAAALSLEELLEGRDVSHPHRYSAGELFAKGEVVQHTAFGTGVVVEVRGDRFDAIFPGGIKTLAQRKAYAALLKRHERPRPTHDSAEDLAESEGQSEQKNLN
jgi:hypothetical protein